MPHFVGDDSSSHRIPRPAGQQRAGHDAPRVDVGTRVHGRDAEHLFGAMCAGVPNDRPASVKAVLRPALRRGTILGSCSRGATRHPTATELPVERVGGAERSLKLLTQIGRHRPNI